MKRTKIRNILLSALLALTVGMPMISFADEGASAESGASGAGETPYAAGDKDAMADPNTASTWRNWGLDYSTQSVGRIWTDKTVSTGDIVLTGAGGTMAIEKSPEADFLTAFSALSSTSNLKSTVAQPLDIVLVLDASGSMDDPMGNGDNTKRIDALKAAANSFIDEIAKQNANISDPAQQHQVSLVKFSGNKSNQVGNSTYRNGGYTYNYSQVMKNLTPCVGTSADNLKSTVKAISPAGSTRADYGLQLAADQTSGRENAKKIVVFFTDGSPTSSSGFENDVASSAISAAKSMKDAGATIYSVGIFSGVNPSADPTDSSTSNENKFMHAVSSNYPTASYAWQNGQWPWESGRWVWNFGARAADSDFYKAASNAADLKTLFDEISQEITSSTGLPTEVQQGYDPSTSGCITFTDQLGDYMKVDSFTTIVFAKQRFQNPVKTTSGNVDTYTFSGEAGNVLYPSGNLNSIIITVTKSDDLTTGDLVEVKVPAALIPLRHFQIDESAGTGSVDLTFPIRVFFESSVKPEAAAALANPDAALAAYIEANTTDNGVAFYANKWSGVEDGDAAATFTPAKSNSYYYMTEETPIFADEACTVPAKGALSSDGTYYYKRSWYEIDNGKATLRSGAIQFSGNVPESWLGYIGTDTSGNAVFKAGAPRFTYINELCTSKGANPTATATTVLNPVWAGSNIASHLGNNGKLVIEKPGTLAISKSLVVPEGYERADFGNDTFTFAIEIDKAEGQEFPAEVRDANNEPVGDAFTIAFDNTGKATHSLKDGETLYIRGLSAGWGYLVSEQLTTGFDQIAPAENNDSLAATGTIVASAQAKAEFTNAYRPSGTLDGGDSLNVHKVLKGRDWTDNDAFRFILTPKTENAPMPRGENGEPADSIGLTKRDLVDGGYAAGTFGNITYTKPGTYVYEISEDQTVGAGAGMSLSQARYRVVVTVTEELAEQGDNAIHQGILNVSSVMVQINNDDGASVQSDDGVDAATFTNEFAAREAKWNPAVKKEYTDNSGANPLARGMFNFRIEPVMDNNPMPKNPIGEVNADGSVTFEDVVFTGDMIGKSFQYRITEVVPDGAGNWVDVANADASQLQGGMTYDKSTWIVTVAITSEIVDGEQVVVWTAGYQRADAPAKPFATFRNSYTPESATVPAKDFASGTKTLTGRDMLPNETFGFELLPADDATQSAIANGVVHLESTGAVAQGGTNGHAVNFSFGDATFTKPGTYTFMVCEDLWNGQGIPADGTQGMAFDRHTATIVMTVTDNNGVLSATRTVENSLGFTNRYTAEGDYAGLVLSKTLNGRNMDQGEFSFRIAGTNDAAKGLLGGDGTRAFVNSESRAAGVAYEATLLTDLHFTQDDVGETLTFDVSESVPTTEAPGMTYDKTTHSVAISVASDNVGALVITTTVDGAAGNKVSFTNAYAADPATFDTQAGFGLYKVLEGCDWQPSDAFSFLLEPLTMGAPLPGDTIVTVGANRVDPATGHASISFGDITYNQVGVYKYRVTETNAGYIIGGVKYSSNAAEFTVTVTDLDENGVHTGKLVATAQLTTTPNTREFTNVAGFEYDDNQIPANAFKRFANNSAVEMPDMTGLFTFELTAAEENAPMPAATTAHNAADGSVDFGVINFDASLFDNGPIVVNSAAAAGAKSVASESNAAVKTVASDVSVADAATVPAAGALTSDSGDTAKGEGSAPADMKAAPAADAAAVPAANDAAAPAGDAPTTDNPPVDVNTLVFHYTISEKAGGHADVANDPNPAFTFEVTVTRDTTGNVTANVTNVQDYVKGTPLRTFTNTYTCTPPVIPDPDPIFAAPVAKKILEGRAMVAGEFSFELLENGKVVSTGTNDADGNVMFSDIEFTEAGTHIYTMREIGAGTTAAGVTYDATTYQVTATVVEIDNELRVDFALDGADAAVFKNAYAAKGTTVIIGATKTLDGRSLAAGEFTFKLTGADGRTYEAKNAADGRIEFTAIDLDRVGTYDFTLAEVNDGQADITYDDRSYKVTVAVTDDGKGNLVANVTWPDGTPPTFKNIYTKPAPAVTPGTSGEPPAFFAKTGDKTMPIVCAAILMVLVAGAVGAVAFGALRKSGKGDKRR